MSVLPSPAPNRPDKTFAGNDVDLTANARSTLGVLDPTRTDSSRRGQTVSPDPGPPRSMRWFTGRRTLTGRELLGGRRITDRAHFSLLRRPGLWR